MEKRTPNPKPVHSTASPYLAIRWPAISPQVEEDILQLLLPLVRSIGDHRRRNLVRSKGNGRKKRTASDPRQEDNASEVSVVSYLTTGFNSTMRQLENSAKNAAKPGAATQASETAKSYLSVVIARKTTFPAPVDQSFPVLVATASRASDPIRLIEISANAEASLSAAMDIPRLSVLGIGEDAPGFGPLIAYVREHVDPVHAPWLMEMSTPLYQPLKINTTVAIGPRKASHKRKGQQG